jgi:hypothetical protein
MMRRGLLFLVLCAAALALPQKFHRAALYKNNHEQHRQLPAATDMRMSRDLEATCTKYDPKPKVCWACVLACAVELPSGNTDFRGRIVEQVSDQNLLVLSHDLRHSILCFVFGRSCAQKTSGLFVWYRFP